MPPFVGFLVELSWKLSVGFRRYDGGDAPIRQVVAQPICVEGPVRQKVTGCPIADQRIGLAQVVGLPGHQKEINEVSKPIRQRQYLRCYASARAPNGLAKSPPFAP